MYFTILNNLCQKRVIDKSFVKNYEKIMIMVNLEKLNSLILRF